MEEKQIKQIPGFNYTIDEDGNVFNRHGKQLKPAFNRSKSYNYTKAYKFVYLTKEHIAYKKRIHRLVYEAFVGPIPTEMTIDHIDNDKENNHISNLQLLSQADNVRKYHKERREANESNKI